jgi:signal transduction histidine kinase
MSPPDLSAVAHELKSPLAVINGFAELLSVRDDERTRKEAAERILDAASQLSKAIDDLLDMLDEDAELGRSFLAAKRARGVTE